MLKAVTVGQHIFYSKYHHLQHCRCDRTETLTHLHVLRVDANKRIQDVIFLMAFQTFVEILLLRGG